jgi:hypothetical protein
VEYGYWGDRNGYSDHADIIGRHFCVSYAYPDLAGLFHEIGQSVCLDNGAFTMYTRGKVPDWTGFYKWAERWLEFQSSWAIIPDVMGGADEENDRLLAQWPFGHRGAPVWHPNESFDRLRRLRDEWPLICIGGAADYEPVASPKWKARIAMAMDVLCDENGVPLTKIHMLRGLRFSAGPYPLYSADSVSVVRGRGGMPSNGVPPKSVRKMLDAIDGRNPPARWVRQDAMAFDVGTETTVEVVDSKTGMIENVVSLEFSSGKVDDIVEKSLEYADKPRKVHEDKPTLF